MKAKTCATITFTKEELNTLENAKKVLEQIICTAYSLGTETVYLGTEGSNHHEESRDLIEDCMNSLDWIMGK